MVRAWALIVRLLGALAVGTLASASSAPATPVVDLPLAAERNLRRGHQDESPDERRLACFLHRTDFWNWKAAVPWMVFVPAVVVALLLSGFFTTLTLGLMGMDTIGLEIVERGDDPELARCAHRILGLRRNPNQLMCTLMLGNVTANAMLAILAADAFTLSYGLASAVLLTLLFGEILPQALLSGYTIETGARMVPIANCLIFLLYPFTKPMSMVLNIGRKEMGVDRTRAELIERLQIMSQQNQVAATAAADETAKRVAEGALQFRNKHVLDVMTPLEDAYMLPSSTRLGYTNIREIFETGFTRVPVYGSHKNDYTGVLHTKDLMLADPEDQMKLGDFITIFNRKVETFSQETTLVEVLNKFKTGGTHMGLVREANIESDVNPYFEIRGVVTLEDVIEEILQDEIVDETDVYKDVDNQVKVLDGRETRVLDLAVFNPLWKSRKESMAPEEVRAISSHLQRECFYPEAGEATGLTLSIQAIEWLVAKCGIQNRTRKTPYGTEDVREEDILYDIGREAAGCTLVVQGRLGIRAGRDLYRSEIGAFSLIARDALRPGHTLMCDYRAFVLTSNVRFVHISKVSFLEALVLDRSKEALAEASATLAAEHAGEMRFGSDRDSVVLCGSPRERHSRGELLPLVPVPSETCSSSGSPRLKKATFDEWPLKI